MSQKPSRWALPAGIDELLPAPARSLEQMRRRLLDLFDGWGYDLVIPPMVEFVDSLLIGAGEDLDIDTLKMTDGHTGRQMGLRADMTPQVARIDAHSLPAAPERRLCYLGTVMRARTDGMGGSRSPMQVGAELYGVDAVSADIEMILLMVDVLATAGVERPVLDLGHVGVFRSLAATAGLDDARELALRDSLQRKALPEIAEMLDEWSLAPAHREALQALGQLHGPWRETLDKARAALAPVADEALAGALDRLAEIGRVIAARCPRVDVLIDLSELHGYHYQTGLVFAAYADGAGSEIARGGRYDEVGQAFGRARPATGFSTDLRALMRLSVSEVPAPEAVHAPADFADDALMAKVAELRAAGRRVILSSEAAPVGAPKLVRDEQNSWHLSGK